MPITLSLHPRQFDVLDSVANEILYGGAVGAGKSYLLRLIAIAMCMDNPGLQVYIFRRHYADLISNHFSGFMSFPEMLAPFIETGQAKISMGDCDIKFDNGSAIHGRHCQHETDVIKYQGAEIHVLLIDELTHFSDYIYRFLRGRVRLGGLKVKDQWKNKIPGIISGSNPGNIGHAWVKRTFIDNCKPDEIRTMPPEEGGMRRQFVPARLTDNPTLIENDPLYVTRLSGLGAPDLVKAMLDGNWDIVAGAAFENLHRSTHQIRQFTPLKHWTKFMATDWGTAKPYSVGWYCVPDEDVLLAAKGGYKEMLIPKNSIIRYREMYGWNGKPDEGCREESWQVAQKMLAIESGCEDMIKDIEAKKSMLTEIRKSKTVEKIDYRIGDSAMWSQHDGPSVAEKMAENGIILEQSHKDRAANYLEMRARINPPSGLPGFYVTDNCVHFWRTVPELQLDERQPEKGPDTRQEDHCFTEDTKIITASGAKEIKDIEDGELVLTTDGYRECINLGITGFSNVLEITTKDGYKFQATGNHPMLTSGGMYVRLDSLHKGDKLCALKPCLQKNKDLMELTTTCAASTTRNAESDCTGLSGSSTTARYQKATTYTTKTGLAGTIKSKILSLLKSQTICPTICRKDSQTQSQKESLLSTSLPSKTKLKNGTAAQLVKSGTVKRQAKYFPLALRAFVKSALMSFSLNKGFQPSAQASATLNLSETEILDITQIREKKSVWNLHVPGPNNFVLENGIVVHNCYDEVAYALASRPMTWTRAKRTENDYDDARRKAFDAERGGSTGRYSSSS